MGKAKTTVSDHLKRGNYEQFCESRLVPLRRWKEIGALGHSATKASLIHATSVDKMLKHFRPDDVAVLEAFVETRRTTLPPACRHRAGARDRDHLIL